MTFFFEDKTTIRQLRSEQPGHLWQTMGLSVKTLNLDLMSFVKQFRRKLALYFHFFKPLEAMGPNKPFHFVFFVKYGWERMRPIVRPEVFRSHWIRTVKLHVLQKWHHWNCSNRKNYTHRVQLNCAFANCWSTRQHWERIEENFLKMSNDSKGCFLRTFRHLLQSLRVFCVFFVLFCIFSNHNFSPTSVSKNPRNKYLRWK